VRRFAPRVLAVCAAGSLAAAVAGCTAPAADAVRLAVPSAPVTLDPRYATDAVAERVCRLLYARLVDFDAAARAVPALADWRVLSPLHYRFRLRTPRRPFHDGTPVTAHDVAATFASILAPASASAQRGALSIVRAIRVLDDDTVDFHLHRPDALFPGLLTTGILPAARIESGHAFARHPIGSGPLRFVAWPDEARLRLRRVDDDQVVEFVAVRDPTVRALKLVRGEADIIQGELPPEIGRWLRSRAGIRWGAARGSTFSYLGFHLQDPLTGRRAVREAVARAIDREAIVEHLFGAGARVADAVLVPWHWAGHPDLVPLGYDPQRARALLAGAGFDDARRPRLVYKTSNNPFRVRVATVIREQLAAVGFDVRLQTRDWGTFYADVKAGRFQMYGLSWVALKMPDIFRYAFHSDSVPPAGANRGRFASARVDRLIERAEALSDLRARVPLYRALHAQLLAELPYVPLWYEDHVAAWRDGVEGYVIDADGSYDALAAVRVVRR